MSPALFSEGTLVQQTTAEYREERLGWYSVNACSTENYGLDSPLGRTGEEEGVLTLPPPSARFAQPGRAGRSRRQRHQRHRRGERGERGRIFVWWGLATFLIVAVSVSAMGFSRVWVDFIFVPFGSPVGGRAENAGRGLGGVVRPTTRIYAGKIGFAARESSFATGRRFPH